MIVWLILITGSLGTGYFFGTRHGLKRSLLAAYLVPWFVLLAAILITEALVPYQGGGASMWPIAQFFGGTAAAVFGGVGHKLARARLARRSGLKSSPRDS